MTTNVQVRPGHLGYRHQLDRSRRFLDRVEGPHPTDVAFQDMMWAFFQNCWHIKDWVKNDPAASPGQKAAVDTAAHAPGSLLLICRDLCNGTKHVRLTNPSSGSGAWHSHVDVRMTPGSDKAAEYECWIDDGTGNALPGKQFARDCLALWERILKAEGLATARLS